MHRSLLPFILVSLGFTIVLLATAMPLFEWQIDDVTTDFLSTYDVHIHPSPWIARVGDSLDHGLYVHFGQIYVSNAGRNCRHEDVNFVVKRPPNDEALEQMATNVTGKIIPWLYLWGARVILLSVIYIWWFTIWQKRPIWEAIVSTTLAGVFYFGLSQIVRNVLPRTIPFESAGALACYHGTITFNAMLLKVHYDMPIVFFTGILLELGALGIMVREIIRAVMERKKISKTSYLFYL